MAKGSQSLIDPGSWPRRAGLAPRPDSHYAKYYTDEKCCNQTQARTNTNAWTATEKEAVAWAKPMNHFLAGTAELYQVPSDALFREFDSLRLWEDPRIPITLLGDTSELGGHEWAIVKTLWSIISPNLPHENNDVLCFSLTYWNIVKLLLKLDSLCFWDWLASFRKFVGDFVQECWWGFQSGFHRFWKKCGCTISKNNY